MGILAGPAMGNASLWVWMIICICAVNVSPQIIDMDTGDTEGLSHDVVELRPSKQIFPRQTAGSNAQPFSRLRRAGKFSSILWPTTATSKMPLELPRKPHIGALARLDGENENIQNCKIKVKVKHIPDECWEEIKN